jgi:hypothetical protein
MTSDQVGTLRELNAKLERFLEQMKQPSLVVSSEELAELLKTVVEAGEWIKDPSVPATETDGESVLLAYRTLLERLRGVLPLLEVRLRVERARLESERSQLASAAQWTAGAKAMIASR